MSTRSGMLQGSPMGTYAAEEIIERAHAVTHKLRSAHERRLRTRMQDLHIQNDLQPEDLGHLILLDRLMADALKKRPAHVMKTMGEIRDFKEYIAECHDAYDRGLPVLQPRPSAQALLCEGPALSTGKNLYVAPFTLSMRKRSLSRIWAAGALTGCGMVAYYGFEAEPLAWGFALASSLELAAGALTVIASVSYTMKNPYLDIATAIDEHTQYVASELDTSLRLKADQPLLQ